MPMIVRETLMKTGTHAHSGVITAWKTAGMDGERQVRIQAVIVRTGAARLRSSASSSSPGQWW